MSLRAGTLGLSVEAVSGSAAPEKNDITAVSMGVCDGTIMRPMPKCDKTGSRFVARYFHVCVALKAGVLMTLSNVTA